MKYQCCECNKCYNGCKNFKPYAQHEIPKNSRIYAYQPSRLPDDQRYPRPNEVIPITHMMTKPEASKLFEELRRKGFINISMMTKVSYDEVINNGDI